jgi:hypothetical protein
VTDRPSRRDLDDERSPWSRASVLFSGAFLLALVLLGIVLATTAGTDNSPGDAVDTQTPARRPATTQVQAGASVCSLPAGSQTVPYSSPPAAQWGTVGSMQVPQNPALFGPQRTDGPWDTCFAHDPSGALLAAMNLWAEGTAVAPSALAARLAVGAPKNLGSEVQLDSDGPIQFAGYRYGSYTPAVAQVVIVFRGPEGKLLAVATTMVWAGGDWKYLFPSDGSPAMQVLADLSGYVQWSGF